MYMIKQTPLTYMFNNIFKTDEVPSKLNLSKVKPISRKNYKLNQIINLLRCFRVKSSSAFAIGDATNFITTSLDKNYFTIFIDPGKSVRYSGYSILYKKMVLNVVRGLSGEFLTVHNSLSGTKFHRDIDCCVPHGSVSGTIRFD